MSPSSGPGGGALRRGGPGVPAVPAHPPQPPAARGARPSGSSTTTAEAMGRQVYRSTRRLFARMAAERPTVVVVEDVHWLDGSSAALLEHLLALVDECAPPLLHRRSAGAGHAPRALAGARPHGLRRAPHGDRAAAPVVGRERRAGAESDRGRGPAGACPCDHPRQVRGQPLLRGGGRPQPDRAGRAGGRRSGRVAGHGPGRGDHYPRHASRRHHGPRRPPGR